MSAYRPSRMLGIVILSVVLFVAWAAWFDIDQTVRAQGQLIPGGRTQVIQVVDGGVLSEIRVQEGDTVKAGQVLAVLEPDRAKASFDEAQAKYTALRVVLRAPLSACFSTRATVRCAFLTVVWVIVFTFALRRRAAGLPPSGCFRALSAFRPPGLRPICGWTPA